MGRHVEIEDIEEMRRLVGIEDVPLREAILGLRSGDHVRLTVRADPTSPGETLLVRITAIRGPAFRGRLVERPASPRLAELQIGALLNFTTAHIHSLPKGPLPDGP
jgi:hypothetical protein